jgi:hypothetical protein
MVRILPIAIILISPFAALAADADAILKSLDSKRGLVVVVGEGDADGKLAFDLARKSELTIFVQRPIRRKSMPPREAARRIARHAYSIQTAKTN